MIGTYKTAGDTCSSVLLSYSAAGQACNDVMKVYQTALEIYSAAGQIDIVLM